MNARTLLYPWRSRHDKAEDDSGNASTISRYGFSAACVFLAWAMRELLTPVLGSNVPYAFFGPAAMIVAWYGGVGPAIFALAVGLLAGYYFFEEPAARLLFPPAPVEIFRLLATAIPAGFAIWLIELLRRSRERVAAAMSIEHDHALRLSQEMARTERIQQELQLNYEITRAVGEAATLQEALGTILQNVCGFTQWSIGHAWIPNNSRTRMEMCPMECAQESSQFANFKRVSEQTTFAPGMGLIGKVWQDKRPIWVIDVSKDQHFIRADEAARTGLKAAIFFPILARDEVIAILEFFHTASLERDQELINFISAIADQLGNVVLRKRIESDLRESERRLNEAQSVARIGNWEWDIPSNELLWSRELYQLYGETVGNARRLEDFWKHLHPDDRPHVEKIVQTSLESGDDFSFEHRLIGPDGRVRQLQCRGQAVRNSSGRVVKLLGTEQDITEQKAVLMELQAARAQLQEYATSLEKKVAERTAALEKSVKQLEGFCYTIAHDLRAPLRAMGGLCDAIITDYGSKLDHTGQDYANRIMTAAWRMDQLIQDLLAYGRLSHADFPRETFELNTLIEELLADHVREIRTRNIEVIKSCGDLKVWSNRIVLKQILSNLIENGLKFSQPGVQPRLEIKADQIGDKIRISVRDNGIGIPKEFQNQIFGVFQRLHRQEEYEGTGIGLAIVSKGIERLEGQLGLESEPGKGSCFWIELPDRVRAQGGGSGEANRQAR